MNENVFVLGEYHGAREPDGVADVVGSSVGTQFEVGVSQRTLDDAVVEKRRHDD